MQNRQIIAIWGLQASQVQVPARTYTTFQALNNHMWLVVATLNNEAV